jgi:hypothetical protein
MRTPPSSPAPGFAGILHSGQVLRLGHDPAGRLYLTQEVAEQCVLAFVSPVSTAWFLALSRARILEAVSESDVPCADPASLSAQTKRTTQNIVHAILASVIGVEPDLESRSPRLPLQKATESAMMVKKPNDWR